MLKKAKIVDMRSTIKNKILVIVPPLDSKGGIANYYSAIKKYYTLPVEFYYRGTRSKKNIVQKSFSFLNDYIQFIIKIKSKEYRLIHLNVPFSLVGIIRDGVYILLAKAYHYKVIVFFHGWNDSFANKIEKRFIWVFKKIFFKADYIIDLSNENKNRLISWGYKGPIYLETTLIDDKLIENLNELEIEQKYLSTEKVNLLFLTRVEKYKGINEAIDAFSELKNKYEKLIFTIAGDGAELPLVKAKIKTKKLKDIFILGYIEGREKTKAFRDAHIYLFPSYAEGMPISVLEAMAFGLPVVTTNVGGLKDFFLDDKMGYLLENHSSELFSKKISHLIENPRKMKDMALYNFRFSKQNFLASMVAKRIEDIYKSV